jgi:hypothetical protein
MHYVDDLEIWENLKGVGEVNIILLLNVCVPIQ